MPKKGEAITIVGGTWAGHPAWLNAKKENSANFTFVIVEDEDGDDYATRIHSHHWHLKGMMATCTEHQIVMDFPDIDLQMRSLAKLMAKCHVKEKHAPYFANYFAKMLTTVVEKHRKNRKSEYYYKYDDKSEDFEGM